MPLVHNNRQEVKQNDARSLQDMLQASLQNIIGRLEYFKNYTKRHSGADADGIYDPVIKVYQDGLDQLGQQLQRAQNGRQELTVPDFIRKMHKDLAEKAISTLDRNHELFPDIQNVLISDLGGTVYPGGLLEGFQPEERDLPQNYQNQVNDFELADEPLEGVSDISEYQPESGRILQLYDNRSGNSNTLKPEWVRELEENVERTKDLPDKQAYKMNLEKLNDAKNAVFGLHAGAEYTRVRSSEMIGKQEITFGDVYETFTNINKMVRPGDPDGGKLRGGSITAGSLKGPGATAIPEQTYRTLQTIAENMNRIKQTEDPALRKTRAIQLAAFAYQMTLSQHVFNDGNGRTCRLFADSILQTFGLPPHSPTKAESDIIETLGEGHMDFNEGAKVFLENVKKSDLELKKDPEITKERLRREPPEKKPGGMHEKTSLKFSALYEVDDGTILILRDLKQSAKNASGRFRDSQEYKDFQTAIDKSYALAQTINTGRDSEGFNLKQAEAEYASSIRKLFKTAADYKTYKMKDHTEDPLADPNKKRLNEKDRGKLDLVDSVMKNEDLIKVKKPAEGPMM